MQSTGIVGSGIAGLHLGLFLQQQGIPVTIYSDRTPEQICTGQLPAPVARLEHTPTRKRMLGVNPWAFPEIDKHSAAQQGHLLQP